MCSLFVFWRALGLFYILSLLHTFSSHEGNMTTKNWVWRPLHGLKYISPPSLPERRHGSSRVPGHGCVHLLNNTSWKFHQRAAPVRATGMVQKRQAVRPVHHGQNHTLPGHSPLAENSISSQLLLSGQPVRYRKGSRYGPPLTYKTTPAGSLPFSQQGGPPCWASPLAFGPTTLSLCIVKKKKSFSPPVEKKAPPSPPFSSL